MQVYISLPMTGHENTVRSRYQEAVREVRRKWPYCLIYGPTNISDFIEGQGLDPRAPVHPWNWHMGEDIKLLLMCDAIYLCKGWKNSKGCRIEAVIANENSAKTYKQDGADENL